MTKLIIIGKGYTFDENGEIKPCRHNELEFNPGPYSDEHVRKYNLPYESGEAFARARAAEILIEFDTHGGDNNAVPGSPEGPPNPCGPHRIIEEP